MSTTIPFIRMLGEMIVVGLLHHDVLADLTLNASNVTVGDDGPDGVAPGDYVAMTVRGPGAWEVDRSWTPTSTEPHWSADLDAAVRAASASFGYLRSSGQEEGSITVFIPRSLPAEGSSNPRPTVGTGVCARAPGVGNAWYRPARIDPRRRTMTAAGPERDPMDVGQPEEAQMADDDLAERKPSPPGAPDEEKAEDELEPLGGGAETLADLDEEAGQANRPGTERPPV
jgi:hypothetical protein